MTGILETIRKLVGGGEGNDAFDTDLLIHINSTFSALTQIGVGPTSGFLVTADSKWSDFLGDEIKLEMVKSYVYLKAKLIFDPPQNSSVAQAMKQQADEFEWRVSVEVDPPPSSIVSESEGGDPSV